MGNVARIQKLPSSNLGMNSRPSKLAAASASTTGPTPSNTAVRGRCKAKEKIRV